MIVLKFIYWFLLVLLVIKLISNLLIPFTLSQKKVINLETGETGGISFSPLLEIVLILAVIVVAFFIDNNESIYSIKYTLAIFLGGTVASYIIAFTGVMFVGFFRSKQE